MNDNHFENAVVKIIRKYVLGWGIGLAVVLFILVGLNSWTLITVSKLVPSTPVAEETEETTNGGEGEAAGGEEDEAAAEVEADSDEDTGVDAASDEEGATAVEGDTSADASGDEQGEADSTGDAGVDAASDEEGAEAVEGDTSADTSGDEQAGADSDGDTDVDTAGDEEDENAAEGEENGAIDVPVLETARLDASVELVYANDLNGEQIGVLFNDTPIFIWEITEEDYGIYIEGYTHETFVDVIDQYDDDIYPRYQNLKLQGRKPNWATVYPGKVEEGLYFRLLTASTEIYAFMVEDREEFAYYKVRIFLRIPIENVIIDS